MNKSKELVSTIKLINDKLNFIAKIDNNEPISIDYVPPLGDNLGYTSLELFLLSLTSCVGSTVLIFLRRMNKTILDCEINAKGIRNEDHPTGFNKIYIDLILKSNDLTDEDMKKVIKLSEDTYCPVISMIKGNVDVDIQYKIKN